VIVILRSRLLIKRRYFSVVLEDNHSMESQVSVKGKCCRRIGKKNDVISIPIGMDIQVGLDASIPHYKREARRMKLLTNKCTLLRDLICACFGGASWHSDKLTRPLNIPC
jgi:hypothetical protein